MTGSKKIFKFLLMIPIVFLLVFIGIRIKDLRELPAAAKQGGIPVETVEAVTGDIKRTVDYSGTAAARDEVTLAPKITARVESLAGKEGDRVEKGQLVASLDDSDLASKVNTLKQKTESAKINLEYWEKQTEAYKFLYEEGAISREKYDQIRLSSDNALASLNEARAVLQEAETSSSNSRIYAPIGGVIASIQTYPGDTAVTGKPILSIMDNAEELKVQVQVIEKDLLSLKMGTKALIYLPGETNPLVSSQISKIYPSLDPAARTARVEIPVSVVELAGIQLRPGMSVDVSFVLDERSKALLVPKAAVVEENGINYLFIAREDKAVKQKVTVGISNGKQVEVKKGLKAGEKVIVSNLSGMYDGRKIYLFSEGR